MPHERDSVDDTVHESLQVHQGETEATLQPLKLGERVKALRLGQSLTLEEASKLTGLARSTLSKIENEQISPTFTVVHKLVHGLGIDLPQLFQSPPRGHSPVVGVI